MTRDEIEKRLAEIRAEEKLLLAELEKPPSEVWVVFGTDNPGIACRSELEAERYTGPSVRYVRAGREWWASCNNDIWGDLCAFQDRAKVESMVKRYGGRVVRLVEVK